MNPSVALFVLLALVQGARCASDTINWCYHVENCSYPHWPTIAPNFCSGSRQSPIDIQSGSAVGDAALGPFTFTNFNSRSALLKMTNTGKTVKVNLNSGVQISGGGLADSYDSLQFHLHWGNGNSVPGSEHTVNGKRFAMELHIVNSKVSYFGNTTQAVLDSTGLAALGFLIEASSDNSTGLPASWQTLTSYLVNITQSGQSVNITASLSIDDLLNGVDLSQYYRYLGSLTTPTCNEAVVWTVFKQPIKVSKNLIDLLSNTVRVGDGNSQRMTEVYRGVQKTLPVTTQTSSGAVRTCFSMGLMCFSWLLGMP